MSHNITFDQLIKSFSSMGLVKGDAILVRGNLSKIGRIQGGVNTVIDALISVIGTEGTIVALSYTPSFFLIAPKKWEIFTYKTKSFAGSLPNGMLKRSDAIRSTHPTNSVVCIGKNAALIANSHTPNTYAYKPVRDIITLNGKCLVLGCVDSSPGFTTTHLAEFDTGLYKRIIFPKLNKTFYMDEFGVRKIFRRPDLGMCSQSFYKFYAHYVKNGKLNSGYIGHAYAISISAKDAYEIDSDLLKNNPYFNICDSPQCIICNIRRWDRLYMMPKYIFTKLVSYIL